jgi:hypothetical protein
MKHLLHGILLFVFFLSAACDRKESSKMPISQKMKPYCVGRHLFDVPSEFRLIYPLSGVFRQASHNRKLSTIGIKIVAENLTPIEFAQGVEKRRIELIASRRDKRNLLEAVISPDQNATLFRVSRIEDSYMSEAHLLKGAAYFTAEARSYSGLFEVAEADIFDFASKIALADNINFSQSGFCLGPLIVGGDYEAESVTTVFRSDQRPDVIISISIDSYNRDDPVTLLQRVTGPNSLLEQVDVRSTVLRKGQLEVAGMNAQEWLGTVKLGEHRDKRQHGFALETRRAKPGPNAPRIHLELDSGKQDLNGVERPNSLSDEDAIALWDSVVSSIRPRQSPAPSY